MDATNIVAQDTDELQALTDAYHAVFTALDASALSVVEYVQVRQAADRIAFGVSDYGEAIAALTRLADDVERM